MNIRILITLCGTTAAISALLLVATGEGAVLFSPASALTRTKPDPDTKLVVSLDRESEAPLAVTGAVVRVKRQHPGAASITQPGFGLAIDSAPEVYFQLIMSLHKS
jgi:hypothetical protein